MKGIVDLPQPFGECLIKFNKKDRRIVWELYCELLPLIGINEIEDNDLIIEVINSWDKFSKDTIQKIKELGPRNLGPSIQKKDNTRIFLGTIILELINQHMRSFLRKWKDKFNHYWNSSLGQNPDLDSIKRQLAFPEYDQLYKEVLGLEKTLKEYSEAFYVISQGKSKMKYIYAGIIVGTVIAIITIILLFIFIVPPEFGGLATTETPSPKV